jgi:hypothetical protein
VPSTLVTAIEDTAFRLGTVARDTPARFAQPSRTARRRENLPHFRAQDALDLLTEEMRGDGRMMQGLNYMSTYKPVLRTTAREGVRLRALTRSAPQVALAGC